MDWHYVGSDKKTPHGPIKEAELIRLFHNKTITPETYVWNGKTVKDWEQISSIEGLEWHFQNSKPAKPVAQASALSCTRLVRQLSNKSLPSGSRVRRQSKSMKRKEYNVGDEIKVFDKAKNLEKARVTQVQENRIRIHYVNWPDVWEWINVSSSRIKGKAKRRQSVTKIKNREKRHSVSVRRKRGSVTRLSGSSNRSLRRRHSTQNTSNSLSAFLDLPIEDHLDSQWDKNVSDPEAKDFVEVKVQRDIDDSSRERVVKDFFSIMWEGLQKCHAEGRAIDDEKLLQDLEKVHIENCRMRAEFDALGVEIKSLKDERHRKKRYEEEKESLYFKKKNQVNEFEKVLKDRERKLMLQENDVKVKLEQAEKVQLEKSKLKRLKNEIATLEGKIRSQEDLMSKNIGKALAVGQHDPQALKDLQEMKDKIHSERDRLKVDRDKLSQGMLQVQKAKSQLLMASQAFEQQKEKNLADIAKMRAQHEKDVSSHNADKIEFEKAKMLLKDEQVKINKEIEKIAENKGKIKSVLEENLAQFKGDLQAARQKLNLEEEKIQEKQKHLDSQQKNLDEKEKRLDESLRSVEQQRQELLDSSNVTFNERKLVDQLSRRELELTAQISQLQSENSKLEISSRNALTELASEREHSSKIEKNLDDEKSERVILQKELSECKNKLQKMKEELLKDRVEREVWEKVNSQVRNERDRFQREKQKLTKQLVATQGELDILQENMNELKGKFDDKNNDREQSVLIIDKSHSEVSQQSAPPPSFSGATKASTFENIIFTLINDRRNLRSQEEEVKKRISILEEEDKLLNEEVENLVEDDDMTPPEFFLDNDSSDIDKGQ